jgi:hypothetical protein
MSDYYKLSEVIASYRTDRPDEWSMDIFIRGAEKLEAERDALQAKLDRISEIHANNESQDQVISEIEEIIEGEV